VPTGLRALVEDVVTQHRVAGRPGGVELRTEIDEDLAARHLVDPVRLRQVLGNLVGNALKFTREGGVAVSVVVSRTGDAGAVQDVMLVVADTGIGISPEDQRHLFEPFEQASSDSARNGGGTGLGLVICRQLVEAMGGRVAMESRLGDGTTMRVELPLPVAAAAATDALTGAGAPRLVRRALPDRAAAEHEGSLVLLVEDHPVNREIIARQLEAIGFVTDTAADADAAAALYGRSSYGLVFTDLQLPGADGYELARRLRALDADADAHAHAHAHANADADAAPVRDANESRRPPIVALTASALRGERERCLEAGMDDLVVKPATLATLGQALRRWLPDCAWPAPPPGGPPPLRPGEPEIDRSALDELTGGDEQLGREILTRYLESLGEDLDALWGALRDGDVSRLRRHAHQIAGSSRTVGAHAVAAQASRLEQAAGQTGDSRELERLAEGLRQTAAR
jgi:CheY-like chemotaxis protein/HPt (histidine-containing phosphotransfer) domain-containing protein